MEDTRRAFHLLANSLTAQDWKKTSSNPDWSVGQVMFHMTLAPRFVSSDLFLIRRMRWVPRPPAFLFHGLNRQYTRLGGRRFTPVTIRDEYDDAHGRALEALYRVQPDEWDLSVPYPGWDPLLSGDVTIRRLFHYLSLHFKHHEADIRSALDR